MIPLEQPAGGASGGEILGPRWAKRLLSSVGRLNEPVNTFPEGVLRVDQVPGQVCPLQFNSGLHVYLNVLCTFYSSLFCTL